MTSKKPNSRQIQAEERRLQILDKALEVFAAKGFKSTSIKDISEAAGISQGLIYHYFASKDELLVATIKHHSFLGELARTLTGREDQPASLVLREIAEKFLDVLEAKKELVRILIRDVAFEPEQSNAWAALLREGVGLLQKYLEGRISRGEFKPHNTEITARGMLYCIVMFHITGEVFKMSRLSKKEYVDGMLDMILNGIRK